MFCIWIIRDSDGEYTYELGSYNENNKTIYVNFGYGGMVLDVDEDVIAWAPLFDPADHYLKMIE